MSVLLVGQPELREKLRQPELRQLTQRITTDYDLKPLGADQILRYVSHRLRVAGAKRSLFTAAAIDKIAERSAGIPRVVNSLCDLALVYAFAEERSQVCSAIVDEVVQDKSQGGLFWTQEPAVAVSQGAVG